MRKLTAHKTNGCNEQLEISVLDEPGAGGACHRYCISGFNTDSNPSEPGYLRHEKSARQTTVLFQNGPIGEVGVNGVTHEALLAILIDRLESFQAGPYAHPQNENALHDCRAALTQLQKRTAERVARGVEGTHKQ